MGRLSHKVVSFVVLLQSTFTIFACTSVTIIGSSGTLGKALLRNACSNQKLFGHSPVYINAIHRSTAHYDNACHHHLYFHQHDLLTEQPLSQHLFNSTGERILINAAGVCPSGVSKAALKQCLQINARAPLLLTQRWLSDSSNHSTTVVNISSGDGELCYLNTQLQRQILDLTSFDELLMYIELLINNHDADFDYAFGDTPFYSLSKALLNRGTQLLHEEFCDPFSNDHDGTDFIPEPLRVIAVCPGNFQSPMSTAEEAGTAQPVEVAAAHIWAAALQRQQYKSGRFYRYGEEICW